MLSQTKIEELVKKINHIVCLAILSTPYVLVLRINCSNNQENVFLN